MEQNLTPWQKRDDLPSLKIWQVVLNTFLIVLFSSVSMLFDYAIFLLFILLAASLLSINIIFYRKLIVLLSIPASVIISVILYSDLFAVILSNIFIIVTAIIVYCLFNGLSKNTLMLAITVFNLVLFCSILYIQLTQTYGSLSNGIETIEAYIKSFYNSIIDELIAADPTNQIQTILDKSLVDDVVLCLKMISPSLIIVFSLISSFIEILIFNLILAIFKVKDSILSETWKIIIPRATGVIFTVSLLAFLIINLFANISAVSFVLINIIITFSPLMIYYELSRINNVLLANKKLSVKIILAITFIVCLLLIPSIALIFIMILTVVGSIRLLKSK